MGWTVFQPRREQWTRQRYQVAPPESLRSRPQLENRAKENYMQNGSPQRSGVLGSARVWPVKQMREREICPSFRAAKPRSRVGSLASPSPAAESTLPPDGRGDPFHAIVEKVIPCGLIIAALCCALPSVWAQETGISIEAVDNYSCGALSNNIANVDNFRKQMLSISGYTTGVRWTDGNVSPTDFIDPELVPGGNDTANFDRSGDAISYFSGHGICDDQTDTACPRRRAARTSAVSRSGALGIPTARCRGAVCILVRGTSSWTRLAPPASS